MKLSIYLNNYFVNYNHKQDIPDKNLSIMLLRDLSEMDHTFIFRGEPSYRTDLHKILKMFRRKDYILTTDCSIPENILTYDKTIPYISFKWDGLKNDLIRGERSLTFNMNILIDKLKYDTSRIEYTFSPYNKDGWKYDIEVLKYYVNKGMKKPYFSLYQQAQIFNESDFKWINVTKELISRLNHSGLLTQKNLNYLNNWSNRRPYSCISPQDELVIMFDGSVRLCQSHRINEVIGDLNNESLDVIIERSKEERRKAEECPLKLQCWLSYHAKDNSMHN